MKVLAPKQCADHIRLYAHACLHRLRTDWLDVLLCHEGNVSEPEPYFEGFAALKSEGRIRACGISTDDLKLVKHFHAADCCDVVQVRWSLLDRRAETELLPSSVQSTASP